MTQISRRTAVAGGVAATSLVVAGCGTDEPSSVPVTSTTPEVDPGEAIGAIADVPVGGCAVFADARVVVTQPTEGDLRAFSAICTHEGCLVSPATSGDIPCRCHMSFFDPEDGSVVSGPARSPLTKVDVKVDGDVLRRA